MCYNSAVTLFICELCTQIMIQIVDFTYTKKEKNIIELVICQGENVLL